MCRYRRILGAALALLACPSMALAEPVPVPQAKPLGEGRAFQFVEGVDVPRQKPAENSLESATGPATARDREACDIPGAELALSEPFRGGGGLGPMEDAACGIEDPVELLSVSNETMTISFPAPVLISCTFAATVTDWLLQDVVKAADQHIGSAVVKIGSGPGFQCRRRNNLPDGKLSEHALGKALDIAHFEFGNGTTASIEQDWSADTDKGRFLSAVHQAACKRFTTVLGPDADASHQSHLHLDIGCHGQDCTYLICQ